MRRFWEWKCCGWVWQLLPSRNFPGREKFAPKCPTCGKTPERRWV